MKDRPLGFRPTSNVLEEAGRGGGGAAVDVCGRCSGGMYDVFAFFPIAVAISPNYMWC